MKNRNQRGLCLSEKILPKTVLYTLCFLLAGLAIGILAKLLDIYTENIGNVFSRLSIWIFICSLISIFSSSPQRTGAYVFSFCFGMLLTYYMTAALTNNVYSMAFVFGWFIVALFAPFMGVWVWYAKNSGIFSVIICIGVIVVMLFAARLFFDKIRISDIVLAALTGILLLKNRKLKS